jgi:cyclic pyranopterin phosphate synthase
MLIDSFNREVDYLRISVTQRCNFRCQYCMPEKPFEWTPKENLLSYEEMFSFIKVAIDNGIKKIRITGGEPLVREELDRFIAMIKAYKNDIDLALTTNGYLLKSQVQKLKKAGLTRVNISIDSLEKETFWYLTKKNVLQNVLDGIDAAIDAGMLVKLNSVILKNINENEVLSLYNYAKHKGIQIRFIEYMENESAYSDLKTIQGKEIIDSLSKEHLIRELPTKENSAAKLYKDESGYVFGVIEPYDDSFCKTCNRIRLSAEGDLIPCLYFEDSQNIKNITDSNKEMEYLLKDVVKNKPEKNKWSHNNIDHDNNENISSRAFYFTGG